jgi:hypothetical protein
LAGEGGRPTLRIYKTGLPMIALQIGCREAIEHLLRTEALG